jgi:hypothetical protein
MPINPYLSNVPAYPPSADFGPLSSYPPKVLFGPDNTYPPSSAVGSYFLQADGVSHFLLADGSGALLVS